MQSFSSMQTSLKKLRNCISWIIRVWSLCCSKGLYKSAFYICSFEKLVFRLPVFLCFLSAPCFEFDVILMHLVTCAWLTEQVPGALWFCSRVNLWKQKNCVIKFRLKKHASREVLRNPVINNNFWKSLWEQSHMVGIQSRASVFFLFALADL